MSINCGEAWKKKQKQWLAEDLARENQFEQEQRETEWQRKYNRLQQSSNTSRGSFVSFLICISILAFLVYYRPISSESICQTKTDNLFMGHSEKDFTIKTLAIERYDDKVTTIESSLHHVQWAQLRLYPTIGCTRPTLFYLADNDPQVRRLEVNEAVVVQ